MKNTLRYALISRKNVYIALSRSHTSFFSTYNSTCYPIKTYSKPTLSILINYEDLSERALNLYMELAWRSGSVMDCHETAKGSILGGKGVKTDLHFLRKGQ